jgi:hypothetical protein
MTIISNPIINHTKGIFARFRSSSSRLRSSARLLNSFCLINSGTYKLTPELSGMIQAAASQSVSPSAAAAEAERIRAVFSQSTPQARVTPKSPGGDKSQSR